LFQNHHIIGGGSRENCYCPACGSSDRERWLKLVLEKKTNIFTGTCRVLHIAPEASIEPLIRSNPLCDYYTGDYQAGKAMNIVDATNIQFKDCFFDYIIMNHVLEHIENEKLCMEEIQRVLKTDGVLILSFPVCTDMATDDDATVIDEDMRLKRYGQKDHVRLYGNDFKSRLERYGINVSIQTPSEWGANIAKVYGLIEDDIIILGKKK